MQYMNVNLAWELYKGVNVGILKGLENAPFYKACSINTVVWNGGNFTFYWLLKMIHELIRIKK